MNDEVKCPKCGSNAWDWANIGFSEAKQCTDCGEIYMMKEKQTMTMKNDQTIIDDVLEQIVLDVNQGDLTAIEEMIKRLPYDVLVRFVSCGGLPTETTK